MITKVYFPGCCLLAESGLLLGCRDPASGSVLVLAVLHFPFVPARVRAYLEGLHVSSGKDLRVLGSWCKRAKEDGNFLKDLREVFGRDVWVHIFKQTSEQLPRSCQVFRKAGPVTMGAFARVIFIRYDQRKVSLAKWLAEGSEVEDPEVGQPVSELAFVFGAASACHELYELDEYNEGPVRTSHWQSGGREGSVVVELVKHVSGPACAVLTYLLAGVASVFGSRMFWFWPLSWLWDKLSMSLQVRHRLAHLREVFSTERADTHVSFMRKANVLCSLLIDAVLGLFIVSLLYREDRISLIADALLPLAEVRNPDSRSRENDPVGRPGPHVRHAHWTCILSSVAAVGSRGVGGHRVDLKTLAFNSRTNVASELRSLLQWLMGVPAGLKLNNALDQTLGRFFLYHIHLWLSYLSVLAPLVRPVLWHAGLSACLGASILLSVASDILSLLTFHIYCFYVYAARLYKLMVYGLTSLWRLFRGKKWNVLRRRVDSCSYDVDQLFLGTLLFTILLFLLPTVALYYLVFSLLRLAVVVVQGALHQLVELINSVPTFALGLRICRGYRLADGITMEVLEQNSSRILHLDMQIQPLSLTSVLRRYRLPTYSSSAQHSWLSLLGKLCAGDLIYPWRHKDEKVE
uniref:Phosphatidylinositol glycan anchor biosynthesis class Q n=1 Tax=Petromyzon marinus TaxID=7757 RepID=S4RBM8_PETMA